MFFSNKNKRIYLDHAATTPVNEDVVGVMNTVLIHNYANPGALHFGGVVAASLIDQARTSVAHLLGTQSRHIVFTRGGTESCNLGVGGVLANLTRLRYSLQKGEGLPHVISSVIEHAAVLEILKQLEQEKKIELTLVPVNKEGIVEVEKIKEVLRPETVLVAIMYANNEIGTIQPIKEIAKLLRWHRKNHPSAMRAAPGGQALIYPLLYVDAIQATNYLDINVDRLGVDMMSLSGSKIYGPKSSGVLYVRNLDTIDSLLKGGDQEFGLRPGTEDVVQIVGFSKALQLTRKNYESESDRVKELRDLLLSELQNNISNLVVNGGMNERLPNNVSVTVPGISGERLVIELDAKGIATATKSACKEDSDDVSHVLAALANAKGEVINPTDGAVRFSLGKGTTRSDIKRTAEVFIGIVKKIKAFEEELTKI